MKKATEFPDNEGYHNYSEKPGFNVGDYDICGEGNQYDLIAGKLAIRFCKNPVIPIPSDCKKITIVKIEERWKPKVDSGIFSWYSMHDYSDNPNFEKYWEVECEEETLFYELADFLKYVRK